MKKQPNILWIMSDQHHAGCTGYAGHPLVRTPSLDRIAARGVNFASAFANNPICSPSRTCFVTGQYMRTHRMYGNYHVSQQAPGEHLLPAVFRRAGYETCLVGKSHLSRRWDADSFAFIRYTDLCDADRNDPLSCHYFAELVRKGLGDLYEEGSRNFRGGKADDGSSPSALSYEDSIEHFTGQEALAFLKQRDPQRPFYLHMSFQRPHGPILPSATDFSLYDPADVPLPDNAGDWLEKKFAGKPEHLRKVLLDNCKYPLAADEWTLRRCLASYYGLITAIDGEIGRVLDHLEETGELENTIVCYNADHGDFAGEHGLFHKNLGLYEAVQHIPFLISWPGGPKRKSVQALVESVDFFPTICDLCGIEIPSGVEGISLLPVADGKAGKDAVYCEWEMFWPAVHRASSIRTASHRLVYYSHYGDGELYDHECDPGETVNLWNDQAHNATKLQLMQKLLDFTMQYERRTDTASDAAAILADAESPSLRIHHGKACWSELKPQP